MSYKDKATTPAADYRGGALTDQTPKVVKRYPCFAGGCPMPGTIFTGSTDSPGSCAWHFGVLANDIPKVTQVLKDWNCVAYEVNEARRAHMGELACNPKALDDAHRAAWERLQPLVPGWEDQLQPQEGERYRAWMQRLERFLGARVVEVQSLRHRRAA